MKSAGKNGVRQSQSVATPRFDDFSQWRLQDDDLGGGQLVAVHKQLEERKASKA
jgi:hypothetical protein